MVASPFGDDTLTPPIQSLIRTHTVRPHTPQSPPWISTPSPLSGSTEPPSTSPTNLSVFRSQVKKQLDSLRQNKAAGPDGIGPRVLKACVDKLCKILQHLFNLSLRQEKIPHSSAVENIQPCSVNKEVIFICPQWL